MNGPLRIVVSAENSSYIAWQTQLFCFSAITRLGVRPTVVVHRSAASLLPEFKIVEGWGCQIAEAPLFRNHPVGEYPPRNELGTLLTISCMPEFKQGRVLFCEPDMLFVKGLEYGDNGLHGEHYTYLDYTQWRVREVATKLGIGPRVEELNHTSPIGVPYVIPASELQRLARRWLDILDSFLELHWIDIMHAFGLALAIEDIPVSVTRFMTDNHDPLKKLDRSIIHYCYGDWRWDKHAFQNGRSPLTAPHLPSRKGLSGTVLFEMLTQIKEARAYGNFPKLFSPIWKSASETF
jgi:hypothetical protein